MSIVKENLLGRLELAWLSMNYSMLDVEKFGIQSDEHHIIESVRERGGEIFVTSRFLKSLRRNSYISVNFLAEDVLEKLTCLLEAMRHGFVK